MSERNWKCWLGFHDWKHLNDAYQPAYSFEAAPGIIFDVGGRHFYFRQCQRCEVAQQYYPTGAEIAQIIVGRQRIRCVSPPAMTDS